MNQEGPKLETLLRRLSECPSEFVDTCNSRNGAKQVTAIICDHFRDFFPLDDSPFLGKLQSNVKPSANDKRHWSMLGVATWLLHDEWFVSRSETMELAWKWLQSDLLKGLATMVSPDKCVTDPDRREELVRRCLAALDLRPQGETIEQAEDRRTTLDSIERQRVLRATAAAERRAREIREAMARQQALESASRYGE